MAPLKNWDNNTWLSSQKYINSFNEFILKQVKLDKDSRILDIGCGRGKILGNLSNRLKLSKKPIGLDIENHKDKNKKIIFKKIDALVFHSPVDGEGDWRSNSIWMKKDLGNIPGIQWIDTPGHTGKDIVVNGKKCGIKDKMKGGWEEAWPEGKEKLTSEKKFIKIDKKLYKEMKKKGAGHQLVSYSCFDYYHPEIIKFIESKI